MQDPNNHAQLVADAEKVLLECAPFAGTSSFIERPAELRVLLDAVAPGAMVDEIWTNDVVNLTKALTHDLARRTGIPVEEVATDEERVAQVKELRTDKWATRRRPEESGTRTSKDSVGRAAVVTAAGLRLYVVDGLDLTAMDHIQEVLAQKAELSQLVGKKEGPREYAIAVRANRHCPECKGLVRSGKQGFWVHEDAPLSAPQRALKKAGLTTKYAAHQASLAKTADEGKAARDLVDDAKLALAQAQLNCPDGLPKPPPMCGYRIECYPFYSIDKDATPAARLAQIKALIPDAKQAAEDIRSGKVTVRPENPAPQNPNAIKRAPVPSEFTLCVNAALEPILASYDIRAKRSVSRGTRIVSADAIVSDPVRGDYRILFTTPEHSIETDIPAREAVLGSGDGALLSIPLSLGVTGQDFTAGKLRVKNAIRRNFLLGSDYTLVMGVMDRARLIGYGASDPQHRRLELYPILIRAGDFVGLDEKALLTKKQYVQLLKHTKVVEYKHQEAGLVDDYEGGQVTVPGNYVVFTEGVEKMDLTWLEDDAALRPAVLAAPRMAFVVSHHRQVPDDYIELEAERNEYSI